MATQAQAGALQHACVGDRWEGEGVHEIGIGAAGPRKGDTVVRVADKYFRPTEVDLLIGNPAKAAKLLQWDPSATSLEVGTLLLRA